MNTTILIGAFAAVMFLLGYMNSQDISHCVEQGNSYEVCERAFNR